MKWAAGSLAAIITLAAGLTASYRRQWHPCLCGHVRLVHLRGLLDSECLRCWCSSYARRRR